MSDVASTSQAAIRQGSRIVATAIDHPRLTKTNSTAIRAFLREYSQYVREVKERALQITGDQVVSTDVAKPVQMKFFVDSEWLESMIELGFIPGVQSYEELKDDELRTYLESKAKPSKTVVTVDMLDKIVDDSLRTEMTDRDARSRIENLFVSYSSLLRRHGLSWIVTENEKVAVYHVLAAIRPESLRLRLESDLELSHYKLPKDFKGFMAHAVKLSEAFQLVDNGPPTKKPSGTRRGGGGRRRKGDKDDKNDNKDDIKSDGGTKNSGDGKGDGNKRLPVCLYPPHKSKGIRHYLNDCKACPEHEKKALLDKYMEEKAATGPSKSTRAQLQGSSSKEKTEDEAAKVGKTVGRVMKLNAQNGSSFEVTFTDGSESIMAIGRADDGADESIVSSRIAERAVLDGIGRMNKIATKTLQVALKDGEDAQKFTFSRTWTAPRTTLKLAAGPLALLNVEYLVPDNELSAEDVLLGLPILRHLGVDTKTLLEDRRDLLDGTDCSGVYSNDRSNVGKSGRV